jgi:hypothetical protein
LPDGQGFPLFDHGPDDFKHLPNLWPPVDEIAEEDHLAFGMLVRSVGLLVAEEFEELHEFIGMAVNVADQVVHALSLANEESSTIRQAPFPWCLDTALLSAPAPWGDVERWPSKGLSGTFRGTWKRVAICRGDASSL